MHNERSRFLTFMLYVGLAFLYIPMVLLVIYSFNYSKLVPVWGGWSTRWYKVKNTGGLGSSISKFTNCLYQRNFCHYFSVLAGPQWFGLGNLIYNLWMHQTATHQENHYRLISFNLFHFSERINRMAKLRWIYYP